MRSSKSMKSFLNKKLNQSVEEMDSKSPKNLMNDYSTDFINNELDAEGPQSSFRRPLSKQMTE